MTCVAGNKSDDVFFAANFKTANTESYDISYQQVDIGTDGDDEGVSTSRLYGWQERDNNWLNCKPSPYM